MLIIRQNINKNVTHFWFSLRCCSYKVVQGPKKKTKTKQQRLHYNHEVLAYLQNISQKKMKNEKDVLSDVRDSIMHAILTNPAQIGGFNQSEIEQRIKLFTDVGISTNDAVVLSLNIPSCLQLVNSNFRKLLKLLHSSKLPTEKLLYKHPYVGSLDHQVVAKNLKIFEKEFQLSSGLADLLLECPILLSYTLNEHSLRHLKESTFSLEDKGVIIKSILQSVKEPGVSIEQVDQFFEHKDVNVIDTTPAKEFLHSYGVDLESIAVVCPQFFLLTKNVIETCVANISSEPFFFGAEDIEMLLSAYPDVFISFHKDIVQKQAEYIAKVSTTKTRAYKILSEYPELFRDPDQFFHRVKLFETYGIKDGDIGRLMAQKGGTDCFICSEDFTDESLINLLKFYTSYNDITSLQIVVSAPISLSQKSTNIIKSRLSYMRHKHLVNIMTRKKKTNRSQVTIQSIVRISLKEFVENVCSSTMDDYELYCKDNKLRNYKAEYRQIKS